MVNLVTSQAALRGWNHVEAPALRLERAVVESADGSHRDVKNLDLAGLWLNVHFGADEGQRGRSPECHRYTARND